MCEEHLACPQCGYDLHGIPEVRCPECGFRYDWAALRSLGASTAWMRLAVARRVVIKATIAGALVLPGVCDRLGVHGWAQFGVFAVAYMSAFLTWVFLSDAYRGLGSIPTLLMVFLAGPVAFRYTPIVGFLVAGGVVTLASAWFNRLVDWPALSPAENVRSPGLRLSVVRYSVAATSVLILASFLLILAVVR